MCLPQNAIGLVMELRIIWICCCQTIETA